MPPVSVSSSLYARCHDTVSTKDQGRLRPGQDQGAVLRNPVATPHWPSRISQRLASDVF
jgi:hypothetical protein